MPGIREVRNGDAVTPRRLHKKLTAAEVTAEIALSVEHSSVPVLDTTSTANAANGLGGVNPAIYGRDARLNLGLILKDYSSVTVQLWQKSEVEGGGTALTGTDLPATQDWVFVGEKTVTRSELWVIANLPPGKYKVKVTAATPAVGTPTLHILEQHAA